MEVVKENEIYKIIEDLELKEDKRIEIGTQFYMRGKKAKDIYTVVDIYTTYNSKKEIVHVRYVAEHEVLGQKVMVYDLPGSMIIRGKI